MTTDPNDSDKAWDAQALAVGRVAMAWNALQEVLGEMYGNLFSRSDSRLALVSWHSLVSDVSQQEMLRAAALELHGNDSRAYKEINWMLEQIKQVISHQRNFGIHTPFMILNKLDNSVHVLPYHISGNRKARALKDMDVLKEFTEYEKQIRKLTTFAFSLNHCLSPNSSDPEGWPSRPQLQHRAPTLNKLKV